MRTYSKQNAIETFGTYLRAYTNLKGSEKLVFERILGTPPAELVAAGAFLKREASYRGNAMLLCLDNTDAVKDALASELGGMRRTFGNVTGTPKPKNPWHYCLLKDEIPDHIRLPMDLRLGQNVYAYWWNGKEHKVEQAALSHIRIDANSYDKDESRPNSTLYCFTESGRTFNIRQHPSNLSQWPEDGVSGNLSDELRSKAIRIFPSIDMLQAYRQRQLQAKIAQHEKSVSRLTTDVESFDLTAFN